MRNLLRAKKKSEKLPHFQKLISPCKMYIYFMCFLVFIEFSEVSRNAHFRFLTETILEVQHSRVFKIPISGFLTRKHNFFAENAE